MDIEPRYARVLAAESLIILRQLDDGVLESGKVHSVLTEGAAYAGDVILVALPAGFLGITFGHRPIKQVN